MAALLGGTLLLTWGYLHGNIALSSSGPIVEAAMDLLVGTLLLVGLVGLCVWWWEGPKGLLGAMGFVLGFAGAALGVAHGIHAFVSASGLAELAPWHVYQRAATGMPTKVLRWFPVLPIGIATVGIGSVRTGALGGWGLVPLVLVVMVGCCVEGIAGWRYSVLVHRTLLLWAAPPGAGDSAGAFTLRHHLT